MKNARNICLVLADPGAASTRSALSHPPAGADVLELRIDCLDKPDRRPEVVAELVGAAARPVIATCRPENEGGRFPDPDTRREQLLKAALDANAALVDIEWSWLRRDPTLTDRFPWEKIQLSHHHQGPFSSTVQDIFGQMLKTKAAALKLVARADTFDDALQLVHLTRLGTKYERRSSCFALGSNARISRILACAEGSYLTYVTTGDNAPVPGMLTLEEATGIYRLGDQPYPVKLLGILGHPLGHSLSPVMHNRIAQKLGERYLYIPFESDDPAPVIEFMKESDVRGLSVTTPHKVSVIPLLDGLDITARDAGAVNTIVRSSSRLIGYNTDLEVARQVLAEWGAGPGDRAVVLGAGGAARALLRALTESRTPAIVVSRDPGRARDLAAQFGAGHAESVRQLVPGEFNLLFNATPLGFLGEMPSCPLPVGENAAVLDLAYRPEGTPLTAAARKAGCRVVDGIEFLARQGALQWALWTRRQVSASLYREALEGALAQPARPGSGK